MAVADDARSWRATAGGGPASRSQSLYNIQLPFKEGPYEQQQHTFYQTNQSAVVCGWRQMMPAGEKSAFLPPLRTVPETAAGNRKPDAMDTTANWQHNVKAGSGSGSHSTLSGYQLQQPKLSKSPSAESLQSATSSASNGGSGGSNDAHHRGFSPEEAVRTFGAKLSNYEHTEIYSYPRVYFVGSQAKKRNAMVGTANNCGFDDENGSYLLVPHDHIAYRYEVLKVIGKGSFGQVSLVLH